MQRMSRIVSIPLALAALVLLALPAAAGQGNQIPPGQNPFAYLLGLIEGLEEEIAELESVIEGTWTVANVGQGAAGEVTFAGDGTYTIDSGTYNAGGSWFPAASGTWAVVAGGSAIGFTYTGWVNPQPYSRLAWVECAAEDEIVHFTLGHTHDLEVLTRVP